MKTSFVLRACLGVLLVASFGGTAVLAHTPTIDSSPVDWCLGAASNGVGAGRVEDTYTELVCGNCSATTLLACQAASDCPGAETCVNLTSRSEQVFWDNITDGAVNDLATMAFTQDGNALYLFAELWVDPDPVSLPFAQVAIDFEPGGLNEWWDPNSVITRPGRCSEFTDRSCTRNQDCHFCQLSTEPVSGRVRACGSGCDPDIGDFCDQTQTCDDLAVGGHIPDLGLDTTIPIAADYLLVFDPSVWLISAGATPSWRVFENVGGTWTPTGDALPAVNPGASGGSGGPPGQIEVGFPWTLFPDSFGPGQDFRFTGVVMRGIVNVDFAPDGAIEDPFSEEVAGATTTTQDSCLGPGADTTDCELADGSLDAFVPPAPSVPGGRTTNLLLDRGASDVTLMWNSSCSSADDDYSVYSGSIGNFYDHLEVPGLCSTGGATAATFAPASGDRYYLIVPHDNANEGSYGRDSDGTQRPAATTPCRAQSLGNCG